MTDDIRALRRCVAEATQMVDAADLEQNMAGDPCDRRSPLDPDRQGSGPPTPSSTAARNLVVVRCGDNSLHPGWVDSPRTWDLAVSYFGNADDREFPEAGRVHRYKGGKWDGLFAFFAFFPECLEIYDYIWLPDDDIKAECKCIDLMFKSVADNNFELAQPSLSSDSFLSHLISLHNPLFEYRNVNLVEIMVPILSKDLLKCVLPLFETTKSGFGIDFVWHRFTNQPLRQVAIIDKVQVTHTRPVGGPLSQLLAKEGRETPSQEQERLLAPYGNVVKTEMVVGGKLRSGLHVRHPGIATTMAAIGLALQPFGKRGFRTKIAPWRFLIWIARNWYSNITDTKQFSRIGVVLNPTD